MSVKTKIIVVLVVVLLVVAQMFFGRGPAEPNPAGGSTSESAQTAGETPETTADDGAALPARPAAASIASVDIGGGDVLLVRTDGGWELAGGVPADAARVETLLRHLVAADMARHAGGAAETGLDDGDGLPVVLTTGAGETFAVRVGLRPAGEYDAAYVAYPEGGIFLVAGDVRGDLGLWRNASGAQPEQGIWLEKRVLSFDPERVVRIEAEYPDHGIIFEKSAEDEWQPAPHQAIPGYQWDADELADWLEDLSEFTVAGADGDARVDCEDGASHRIAVTLDDGAVKRVCVASVHDGENMVAVSSDRPGRAYSLPEWRFNKYFQRFRRLFPASVPSFDIGDIAFLDIYRGGESVKLARRDGKWRPVATPFPVRSAQVDRLARLLATWHPEDYADPDGKIVRPPFGGPMVEVILSGGSVHQYRLAGRHPLFPWRYVALDGRFFFSTTDSETAVMFPGFADVLDLGPVLRGVDASRLETVEVADGDDAPVATFTRREDGGWLVTRNGRDMDLLPEEAHEILDGILSWSVTGFYDIHSRQGTPSHRIRVRDADGGSRFVVLLQPDERDIPYMTDGGLGYLADRGDVMNWLAAVEEVNRRLDAAVEKERSENEVRETERPDETAETTEPAVTAPEAEPVDDSVPADVPEIDAGDPAAGTDDTPPDADPRPEDGMRGVEPVEIPADDAVAGGEAEPEAPVAEPVMDDAALPEAEAREADPVEAPAEDAASDGEIGLDAPAADPVADDAILPEVDAREADPAETPADDTVSGGETELDASAVEPETDDAIDIMDDAAVDGKGDVDNGMAADGEQIVTTPFESTETADELVDAENGPIGHDAPELEAGYPEPGAGEEGETVSATVRDALSHEPVVETPSVPEPDFPSPLDVDGSAQPAGDNEERTDEAVSSDAGAVEHEDGAETGQSAYPVF